MSGYTWMKSEWVTLPVLEKIPDEFWRHFTSQHAPFQNMGKNLQCAWKDGPDLMALHQILHFPYRVMFSCDLTPYAPNPRRHKKVFIKRFVFDTLCCTIHRPGWSCGFFNFFYCIYLLPFSLNKTKYGDFVFIFPSITLINDIVADQFRNHPDCHTSFESSWKPCPTEIGGTLYHY